MISKCQHRESCVNSTTVTSVKDDHTEATSLVSLEEELTSEFASTMMESGRCRREGDVGEWSYPHILQEDLHH